jgi:hypothetical protein
MSDFFEYSFKDTWMKAIKYEFDPNNASDPGNYTDGKKYKE